MNKFFIAILIGFIAISCTKTNWEKNDSGIVVYPTNSKEAKAIYISPLNEEIIKVSASATKTFSNKESLVVLPELGTVPFEVTSLPEPPVCLFVPQYCG